MWRIVAIVVFILILWTIAGTWWLAAHIGEKYRPSRWYERILLAPVTALALMVIRPLQRGEGDRPKT